MIETIFESVFAVFAVFTFTWFGIFVGRECGTMENFLLVLLNKARKAIEGFGRRG